MYQTHHAYHKLFTWHDSTTKFGEIWPDRDIFTYTFLHQISELFNLKTLSKLYFWVLFSPRVFVFFYRVGVKVGLQYTFDEGKLAVFNLLVLAESIQSIKIKMLF